jgi:hypothetical protein
MPDELAKVCAQFEALMLKQMLTEAGIGRSISLERTIGTDGEDAGEMDGAPGADITQSMFVDALAQAVAGSDRAGLGHVLAASLRVSAK